MIPEAWRSGEVAVVGLGKSGVAASRWLAVRGLRVYASDRALTPRLEATAEALRGLGVVVELGGHDLRRVAGAAGIVVSPGVPLDALPLVAAREAGVPIVSELDLGARALGPARLIVVTGTNGKTTTTALIAHLLQAGGLRAAAGGNIGRPLTDLADEPERPEWVAVEASSFQLHDSPNLIPTVGVLTNLAPDHLDRYADVGAYYADKGLLFRNASASSVWVLNGDDPAVLELAGGVAGVHRHWSVARRAHACFDRRRGSLMLDGRLLLERDRLRLLGDHNVENALAAALAVTAAGVPISAIAEGLASFDPPPHRLEPVGVVNGVRWINDSKGTNVSATAVALRAMTGPYVLILGGRPKGESFAPLAADAAGRCRAVVAYGEAAERVRAEMGATLPVEVVVPFDEAVRRAGALAASGEAVLLSPACASFDQFLNYEERGVRFREIVGGLCRHG